LVISLLSTIHFSIVKVPLLNTAPPIVAAVLFIKLVLYAYTEPVLYIAPPISALPLIKLAEYMFNLPVEVTSNILPKLLALIVKPSHLRLTRWSTTIPFTKLSASLSNIVTLELKWISPSTMFIAFCKSVKVLISPMFKVPV